jgi:hypothetical protein
VRLALELTADASAHRIERALDNTHQPAARDRPNRHDKGARHQHDKHSLWSIAGLVLGTEDPRRIARYWPRIHRSNRNLIGTTPNLIKPGWVLDLPRECD